MNTTLTAASIAAKIPDLLKDSSTNNAGLIQRLLEDEIERCASTRRVLEVDTLVGKLTTFDAVCAYVKRLERQLEQTPNVWRPIETAPKDGRFVMLAGPSGYSATPLRAGIGRWRIYQEWVQPHLGPGRWDTHSGDAFTEGGAEPTHWMPLPEVGA